MSLVNEKRTSRRGHRQPLDDVGRGKRLGAVGLQELEPRGRRGEEIARLDPRRRAARRRARSRFSRRPRRPSSSPSARLSRGCGFRAATPRRSRAAPRRGSRRWRSRSRSPSGIFDVACRSTESARSASSMPRPSSVTRIKPAPAGLDRDLDAFRPGVERVLDQFLDRRRRPLDHFARGDAVDDQRIETANWHGAREPRPTLSHWRGSGKAAAAARPAGIAMAQGGRTDDIEGGCYCWESALRAEGEPRSRRNALPRMPVHKRRRAELFMPMRPRASAT